jgi:hypothetical protein
VVLVPLLEVQCLLLLPRLAVLLRLGCLIIGSPFMRHLTNPSWLLVRQSLMVLPFRQSMVHFAIPLTKSHQGSRCNTHFVVPNVSFVPQFSMNLLSVGQVTNHNCFMVFDDLSCFI